MRFLPLWFLTALILGAETHQVVPATYYRTFAHTNAVFKRIQPGDVVVTKTLDSGGQDFRGEQVSPGSNPLTGPFYVEGAEAGDAVVVKLTKVRLNRNWGWSGYRLGLFSVMQPDQLRAALARLEPLGASQAVVSAILCKRRSGCFTLGCSFEDLS